MGDNVIVVKTWKEHQSEEKTSMVIRWFLWIVAIGVLTFIIFSTGIFSFQTSLIIGIILFIILFFLFIFRRKVWSILRKQKHKGKKIMYFFVIIAVIIIGVFLYSSITRKPNISSNIIEPIQNISPNITPPEVNTVPNITIPVKNTTQIPSIESVPVVPEIKPFMVKGTRDSIIITNNQQSSIILNITYRIFSQWYGADFFRNDLFKVEANISRYFIVYNNDGCTKGIGDCSVEILNYSIIN